MAALNELIQKIENPELRAQIQAAADKLVKQKKFGLVFEEHLPECTPLFDIPVKKGAKVALKTGKVSDFYTVLKIEDGKALCLHQDRSTTSEFAVEDLVCVAEFGEPIYPYLNPLDTVCNAPDSDLWHTLIEADNYHALQLLEYLYAGKVDCIYIDPPYNTGARDWKYNNDYVDSNDTYRHSKWLSMMHKRLKIAKGLLNPDTGVLIVTIDEHEVHHLRVLLEELFPEFYIQMCTAVINPKGVTQGRFSRVEEYIIYCFARNAFVADSDDNLLNEPNKNKKPRWKGLLRSGTDALRKDRESMFYPIYINTKTNAVISAGAYLPLGKEPVIADPSGETGVAWPIRKDGTWGRWSVGADTLNELIAKGYVSCGKYDAVRKTWGISYISKPNQKKIEQGIIVIIGRDSKTNVVEIEFADDANKVIKTVWHRSYHDAGAYGTDMITSILGESGKFTFPKSLYSEADALRAVVRNKPNALVIDFFAGSGTTLNAINLLNAEDNGMRRCILVTNNECSDEESEVLLEQGFQPSDDEWERHGICRSVTWPRTKNSITGYRNDSLQIEGDYITTNYCEKPVSRLVKQLQFTDTETLNTLTKKKQLVSLLGKAKIAQSLVKADSQFVVPDDEKYSAAVLFDDAAVADFLDALQDHDHISEVYIISNSSKVMRTVKSSIPEILGEKTVAERIMRPMGVGFKTNAAFFKLGFLDKTKVSLGRQFKEMLPTLWMKAGAHGPCPSIEEGVPAMLILPENRMAILNDENRFGEFAEQLAGHPEIEVVYLVTDYEAGFVAMSAALEGRQTYQLYRDYLDNFRINAGRNAR